MESHSTKIGLNGGDAVNTAAPSHTYNDGDETRESLATGSPMGFKGYRGTPMNGRSALYHPEQSFNPRGDNGTRL